MKYLSTVIIFGTRTSFFQGNTLTSNLMSERFVSFNNLLVLMRSKNVNAYDALSLI